MKPIRIHIGHHFYGSGNIGDDLMLAGFLDYFNERNKPVELTCCSSCDLQAMARRFGQVRWQGYETDTRKRCVAECDAWLGLGDSPFQTARGDWFLDHLVQEAEFCAAYKKPMFFLGIGVNDLPALEKKQTQAVLDRAQHLWTRDEASARLLGQICGTRKITAGADLAHLWLRRHGFARPEVGVNGYVLNFEADNVFKAEEFEKVLEAQKQRRHRWLVQEVRELGQSERSLYKMLTEKARSAVEIRLPDYVRAGSMEELLERWGVPEVMLTSRYHTLLVGAWMGCRLVGIERNDKVSAMVKQLGVGGLKNMESAEEMRRAIEAAAPVSSSQLNAMAELAESNCADFFQVVGDQ